MKFKNLMSKALGLSLAVSMLAGAMPAYPVFADNTGTTSVDINVIATTVDITVPANVACTIDPNQATPEDRFQYGELKVVNNGTSPVAVSVTSFTDADSTFEENIKPDGLPDGLEWDNLSVADSAKYFALGIKANDASDWGNVSLSNFVYVPEVTAPNLIGTLNSGQEGAMDLDASFGLAFTTVKDFSYELVFSAELSDV